MRYTLYVDESGDTGIDKVRDGLESKGATPFLVFGGYLVSEAKEASLLKLHAQIKAELGCAKLHCSELSHLQIAKFSRMVAEKSIILCFALVSQKSTLKDYKVQIEGKGQDQKYYNKCVSFFLERVGHAMQRHKIAPEDLRIVFEDRAKHNYEQLRNYIRQIKATPFDPRLADYLAPIDPLAITSQTKEDNLLLSFADLIAYSVFTAVNQSKSNFGVPEQRYMRELKPRFFRDADDKESGDFGAIGEFGLKIFMRSGVVFDPATKQFLDRWHKPSLQK